MNKLAQDATGAVIPITSTATINEGTAQQWQVDPKDIRLFVEENLRGIKSVEYKQFAAYKLNEEKPLTTLWAKSIEEAKELFRDYCQEHIITNFRYDLLDTGNVQKFKVKVKAPLVNEIGAYHILSIIEGVFSRIGYMSNIDDNEINDIMYEDVLQPLVISIMRNHNEYGIEVGSRDEILGFITSTCMLILKSSRKGWAGNRFAGTVHEQIVTNAPKKGRIAGLIS